MRERFVTRTITARTYNVKLFDTTTAQVRDMEITLSAEMPEKKALQEIASQLAVSGCKYIMTNSTHDTETLYGMREADFIKYAVVLPPRSTASEETEA